MNGMNERRPAFHSASITKLYSGELSANFCECHKSMFLSVMVSILNFAKFESRAVKVRGTKKNCHYNKFDAMV